MKTRKAIGASRSLQQQIQKSKQLRRRGSGFRLRPRTIKAPKPKKLSPTKVETRSSQQSRVEGQILDAQNTPVPKSVQRQMQEYETPTGTVIQNTRLNAYERQLLEGKIKPVKKFTSDPAVKLQSRTTGQGAGNIAMLTLPAVQGKPPQIPTPAETATETPYIDSVNSSNPYMQLTPDIYGIAA